MPLTPGSPVGPYEVIAAIGAGGMGEVYRARDSRLGRDVAVKVLPASFADNPDRLRRFEQEARATGMLNHPNILAVYDVGSHDGAPYLVTELLEGQTLREELPSDGRVKILDFGLAKVAAPEVDAEPTRTARTTPSLALGTIGYMSPAPRSAQYSRELQKPYSYQFAGGALNGRLALRSERENNRQRRREICGPSQREESP